jgi:mRNA interferase RelE/StbE
MSYRIVFDRPAEKQFRRLPAEVRQALARRVSALAENPHPPESRKLEGTDDCYRLRQGDYRVVYTILEDRVVVLILRVGHRSSAYRRVSDLTRAINRHRRRPGS